MNRDSRSVDSNHVNLIILSQKHHTFSKYHTLRISETRYMTYYPLHKLLIVSNLLIISIFVVIVLTLTHSSFNPYFWYIQLASMFLVAKVIRLKGF